MKKHSTKQLRCTESEPKIRFDVWKSIKSALIWGVKTLLKALLLRPSTWTWAMVKVPELIEKLELWAKAGISALIEFFT